MAPCFGGHWRRVIPPLVALAILGTAWHAERSLTELVASQRALGQAQSVSRVLGQLLHAALDAETGQRRYLLLGRADDLQPYHTALVELRGARQTLGRLTQADAATTADLQLLDQAVDAKLADLASTLDLRVSGRQQEMEAALRTESGKQRMDELRHAINTMAVHQESRIAELQERHAAGVGRSYGTAAVSFVVNIGLLGVLMLRAAANARRAQADAKRMSSHNRELSALLSQSSAHNAYMQRLSELGRYMQACTDSTEAMALLAQRVPGLMHGRHGALYIMAASRNQLRQAFSWGGERFAPVIEPVECWALRSGQDFVQPDPAGATTCAHLHHGSLALRPGMVCMPMTAHGELSGLLVLDPLTAEDGEYSDVVAGLRQRALELVALSLANLALRESLRQQSIRDALTGLYNRRFLEEALQRELLRATRRADSGAEAGLAVLMVDVDHFKRFNDLHGHEIGDRVLKAVARVLADSVRGSDVAARYGGEEFTIVLSDLDPEAARARAQALCAAVAALPPETGGVTHGPVTVSIGLANHPADGLSPQALLARADQALYAAKRGGRNRVAVAAAGA